MKAIIIDDEPRARVSLQLLLEEFCPNIQLVAQCENLPEGVKAIHKHHPDVVLLDIEMPGHSGLELLDFFDEKEVHFSIIFTTAYNEYAIQAFKLSAIDYLLKPIVPEELVQAIQRVEKLKIQNLKALTDNIQNEKFEKIAVPVGSSFHIIKLDDILYIKGEGAYAEIVLKDKTKLLVSRNLKNFEEMLHTDAKFVRVHKSYIVNFEEVISYNKSDGGWLELSNHQTIPISPDKVNLVLEKMNVVKR
jgi:two-component system, LytTR family, response regulator